MGSSNKMKWKSKDVIGLRAIYHFNKGQWIVDRGQDQEKGGWASKGWAVNCEEVNIWGKLMKDKCCLVWFIMQTRVGAISTNKVELSSVFEGHCPLRKKGGGTPLLR